MTSRSSHEVTVSVRSLGIGALVVLSMLVAYLLGNAGGTAQAAPSAPAPAPAPATAPAAAEPARSLTMSGLGQVSAVPDELGFTLRVGQTRTDLRTALRDTNTTMGRVLAALAGHGVAKKDVQTTGLAMFPVYDYHSVGPPTLRGYRVTQTARVLVHKLADGGAAVTAAVRAGGDATRVYGLRLQVSDPESALARARKAAVAQATAKAREYAAATGQTLGRVVTLREVRATTPPSDGFALTAQSGVLDRAAAIPVPIRAGRSGLDVTVRIVWSLG